MALKTFNIDDDAYREFSAYCKENGISMSKKIDNFIREEMKKIKGFQNLRRVEEKVEKHYAAHSMGKYC